MIEPSHMKIADVPSDASTDIAALIASLHAAGADRFDAVRWHYLQTLSERAAAHDGSAKRMLDAKLAQALATFKERFEQGRGEANEILDQCVQQHPHQAETLQQLFDAGDFKALRRLTAKLKSNKPCISLGALVRQLGQHAQENTTAHQEQITAPHTELKTLRNSRNTWSKLSVDRQVRQALAQAPKNAGPINSHMLLLRSLELMRDISPDYLNRFIAYADTLLCLEQGGKGKVEMPKKRQVGKSAKK